MSDILKEHSNKIKQNVNKHINLIRDTSTKHEDVKQVMYRPITALLTYLARMNKLEATSSFDVVTQLRQTEEFAESLASKVKYAVAVALELRMKVYSVAGNQRTNPSKTQIIEMVGLKSVIDLKEIIGYLKTDADLKADAANVHLRCYPDQSLAVWKMSALFGYRRFKEALNLTDESLKFPQTQERDAVLVLRGLCYHNLAAESTAPQVQHEYLLKSVASYQKASNETDSDSVKFDCYHNSRVAYIQLGNDNKVYQMMTEKESCGSTKVIRTSVPRHTLHHDVIMDLKFGRKCPHELMEQLTSTLSHETDFAAVCDKTLAIIEILIQSGDKSEARYKLSQLVNDIWSNCRKLSKEDAADFISTVVKLQQDNDCFEEALQTVEWFLQNVGDRPVALINSTIEFGVRLGWWDTETLESLSFLEYFEFRKSALLVELKKFDDCLNYGQTLLEHKKTADLTHLLSLNHTECYWGKADVSKNKKAKLEYLGRAIANCGIMTNNRKRNIMMYVETLAKTIRTGDFEETFRHFTEIRLDVRRSEEFQAEIYNYILRLAARDCHESNELFQDLDIFLWIFRDYMLHPLVSVFVKFRGRYTMPKADMEKLTEELLKEHSINGEDALSRAHDYALRSHAEGFRDSAHALWRVINTIGVDGRLAKKAVGLLLTVLLLRRISLTGELIKITLGEGYFFRPFAL